MVVEFQLEEAHLQGVDREVYMHHAGVDGVGVREDLIIADDNNTLAFLDLLELLSVSIVLIDVIFAMLKGYGQVVRRIGPWIECPHDKVCVVWVLSHWAIKVGAILSEAPLPVGLSGQCWENLLSEVIDDLRVQTVVAGHHCLKETVVIVVSHCLLPCPSHRIVMLQNAEGVMSLGTGCEDVKESLLLLSLLDHLHPVDFL